jgi:hypothetical protein
VSEFVTNACTALTTSRASELEQLGYRVRFAATGTPALALTASADEILRLAALPFVDTIYLDNDDKKDHDEDANATHRTTRVHERGVVGRGVDVAILENNRIDENHPWLQNAVAWFDLAGSAPDSHVQSTAGCVASQQQGRIGAAFGANLHSANAASYSDSDLTLAADWITSNGAIDFTNGSFGPSSPSSALDYTDRMFDFKARVFLDSYVMSRATRASGTTSGTVAGTPSPSAATATRRRRRLGQRRHVAPSPPPVTRTPAARSPTSPPSATRSTPWASPRSPPRGCMTTTCRHQLLLAARGRQPGRRPGQSTSTMSTPEAAMALMMATCWHNIEGSDQPERAGWRRRASMASRSIARAREGNARSVTLSRHELQHQRLLHQQHLPAGRRQGARHHRVGLERRRHLHHQRPRRGPRPRGLRGLRT